jgi:hypothetical protein
MIGDDVDPDQLAVLKALDVVVERVDDVPVRRLHAAPRAQRTLNRGVEEAVRGTPRTEPRRISSGLDP